MKLDDATNRVSVEKIVPRCGGAITWGTASFMDALAFTIEDEIGLCALHIGFQSLEDAVNAAGASLKPETPSSANILRDDKRTETVLESVKDGKSDLSIHVQASTFEMTVWEALLQVPRGRTVTYGELAEMAGSPRNAARAVGNILARNCTAIILPCHRVIPTSGKTGNYRWGAKLKTRLLECEQRTLSPKDLLRMPKLAEQLEEH